MTAKVKRWLGIVLFFLIASLLIQPTGLCFDKKTSSALSHYIMAVIYDDLGDLDKAVEEYKKALKVDYNSSLLHLNLASSYIRKNELDKAIQELNLAVSFNPEAVEPHAILAIVYSTQRKTYEANREYEFALKNASVLAPKNIDIYKTLGLLYLQQKKIQDAEKTFRIIIDLAPGDAETHFYLATICDQTKDLGCVEQKLNKAIELNPEYDEALNYLGYFYVEQNKNFDKAEVLIKKALQIEPDNGAYIDSLGWLYFKKGKIKEALKELEKASSLLEDPVVSDHLGDAYFKSGNADKAKSSWENSLRLDPNQELVKNKLGKLQVTNSKAQTNIKTK